MIGLRLEIGYGGAQPLPGYNPATLFSSGQQGAWYDPSDFSTMFQDTAGTVPVTAVGQAVARINDKSGRGNHATQATAAARPPLQQDAGGKYYLDFDGVDNNLSTGNIDLSATNKVTVWAGAMKSSDASLALITEFTTSSSNPGSFYVAAPFNTNSYGASVVGTSANSVAFAGFAAPDTAVLTMIGDVSAPLIRLSRNGVSQASSPGTLGTGNFANAPLFVGSRAGTSLFFNGRLYSLIVRGALADATETAAANTYVAGKTGVTL